MKHRLVFGKPSIWLVAAVMAFLGLCVVRQSTGASELISAGTIHAAVILAIPVSLTGVAALVSERAGVINIGLEGMMILGTWFGAWVTLQTGNPWAGLAAGCIGGGFGGLLHAVATVGFGVDHIISGLAVNIIVAGVARYLSELAYGGSVGGGATSSPLVHQPSSLNLPFLSGGHLFGGSTPAFLTRLADHHWLFVSDAAAVLAGLTSNVSVATLVIFPLFPLLFIFLWRTPIGLRLRSCGENPVAADTLGVPVYRLKYLAVALSGALAGLGGAFLAIVATGLYVEGQTAGRGYIGLALLIFGNWRIGGVLAGAALFGYTDALQLRAGQTYHELLLFLALVSLGWLIVQGYRRYRLAGRAQIVRDGAASRRAVMFPAAASGLFVAMYLSTKSVPSQLIPYIPYLITLVVLAVASQRLRPPAADGHRFRRGEAH